VTRLAHRVEVPERWVRAQYTEVAGRSRGILPMPTGRLVASWSHAGPPQPGEKAER